MHLNLGVVIDPIGSLHIKKDSTVAMLLEAQKREWSIYLMGPHDLFLKNNHAWARMQRTLVHHDPNHTFDIQEEKIQALNTLDVILMRKDPPVDDMYLYTTQFLDHAETEGVLVINKPQTLRDMNEKLFVTWFPQCAPPTLVTSDHRQIRLFIHEHHEVICKPLNGMGGMGIFRFKENDFNISVALEMLTHRGKRHIMVQRFIPEIVQGDKRILMINGEPLSYALARIPAPGEIRGNLAAGAEGVAVPLTARDRFICDQVAPIMKAKGLFFVGLDVIGDYLTEINITSPTCIRELEAQQHLNIAEKLMDVIVATLNADN